MRKHRGCPVLPYHRAGPGPTAKMAAPHIRGSLGKGGQTLQSRVRCEELPYTDNKGRGGAIGARSEMSLQPALETMVEQEKSVRRKK